MSSENDVREDDSPESQLSGNNKDSDYGKSALGESMMSSGPVTNDRSRGSKRSGKPRAQPQKRSLLSSNQLSTGPLQKYSRNSTTGSNRKFLAIFCLVILIGTFVAMTALILRIPSKPQVVPNVTDPCPKDRGLIAKEDEPGCDCLPDRINLLPEVNSQEFCPPKNCDLNYEKSEDDAALGEVIRDIFNSLSPDGRQIYGHFARLMFFATKTSEATELLKNCKQYFDVACKADVVAELVEDVALKCPQLTKSRMYRAFRERWRAIANLFLSDKDIWKAVYVIYKACVFGLLVPGGGLNSTDVLGVYNESTTFSPENGDAVFLKTLADISAMAMLRETKIGGELRSKWATITGATEKEKSDYLFNAGNWSEFEERCYRPSLNLLAHESLGALTTKEPRISDWLAFLWEAQKFLETCRSFIDNAPPLMQTAGNRTFTPLLTFWMINPVCLRKPNGEDCSAIMRSAWSFREKMVDEWACKKVEKWIPFACEFVMAEKFCDKRCHKMEYWQGRSWIRGNEAGGIVLWSESQPKFRPNCLRLFPLP